MTAYSKEEFKTMWDSDDDGGGLTWDDIADCAVAWGVSRRPKIQPMESIRSAVLKAAGCEEKEWGDDVNEEGEP